MIVKIDTVEKAIYVEDGITLGELKSNIPANILSENLKIRFLTQEKQEPLILPVPVYVPFIPLTNPYYQGSDPLKITYGYNTGECTISWDPNLSKTQESEKQ